MGGTPDGWPAHPSASSIDKRFNETAFYLFKKKRLSENIKGRDFLHLDRPFRVSFT